MKGKQKKSETVENESAANLPVDEKTAENAAAENAADAIVAETAAETQTFVEGNIESAAETAENTENVQTVTFEQQAANGSSEDTDAPLDKNVKLMSPTRMVLRRFFRSKLSIAGIIMLAFLFIFSWLGPVVYQRWGETETDRTGKTTYQTYVEETDDGGKYTQIVITDKGINDLADPSADHLFGTDEKGLDVFTRLMFGGRLSLTLSFLAVFLTSIIGIILGGIAGFYGGWVDNIIMRICDMLMCLPTLPLMLIIGTVLNANGVPEQYYIYILMIILSLFSWTGMARLVRGQILYLREQEYMVAAEAMGYSTARRIFKHLIPNILPQILVTMTMSLGSMILYESTLSYLGLGVKPPYASWGTMIEIISKRSDVLQGFPLVWVPSGICILIAVLAFNFIGDGLRDALDPKQRR